MEEQRAKNNQDTPEEENDGRLSLLDIQAYCKF